MGTRRNLYMSGELLMSLSADFDGDVDGDDFLIWQNSFPYPVALSSVPEPSTLILFISSVVVLATDGSWDPATDWAQSMVPGNRPVHHSCSGFGSRYTDRH